MVVNKGHKVEEEIKQRIAEGNKEVYTNKNMMFSKQLTRRCTVRFYKSRIRVVGTYGCEIWVLEDMREQKVRVFEMKVMRKISGPIQNQDGTCRIRSNEAIDLLIENADIVRYIKAKE